MNLEEAFVELTGQAQGRALQRRVPTTVGFDMFIGVTANQGLRSISAVSPQPISDGDLPRFQGLKAVATPDSVGTQVTLSTTVPSFNDLFTVIAQDIAEAAGAADSADLACTRFIARLHSWQRFFRAYPDEGLSRERQQGLYGELVFVRDYLIPFGGPITSWAGGDPVSRDFNFGLWAVEVKTSATKQPQSISISSELQLDGKGLSNLFLWHLSIDRAEGQGQTLPEVVAMVRNSVSQAERNTFEVKLLEAGYLDEHATRYLDGYLERERNIFEVRELFPRIQERDLLPGVGNVRYSIVVDQCLPFSVPQNAITSRFAQ